MKLPRTVPVNLRVSPKFKKWLAKEKKRRRMTAKEITEQMALLYIIALHNSPSSEARKVIEWPE